MFLITGKVSWCYLTTIHIFDIYTFDTVAFLILNIFPFCREDAEKMAALASADKSLLQSSQKQKPVSNNASANSGK